MAGKDGNVRAVTESLMVGVKMALASLTGGVVVALVNSLGVPLLEGVVGNVVVAATGIAISGAAARSFWGWE